MKVKEILSDVQLVIAQIEVELNGELRTSPTLCALIPADGNEQEKIFHFYQADVLLFQLTDLRQEADHIHLIDLVFFTCGNEQCCPRRLVGELDGIRELNGFNVFIHIIREPFPATNHQYRTANGIHTGSAAIAVNEAVLCLGQLVMNDIFNIGNIQPTRCQIGSDKDIRRSVPEFTQRGVPFLLLHGTMIELVVYTVLQ